MDAGEQVPDVLFSSRRGCSRAPPRGDRDYRNACVRCPLLRVDPAQLPRLKEIHTNLLDRLHEAKEHGWLGEVAEIETTMAAAQQKLETMRGPAARAATVHLGMPDVRRASGRSSRDI